MILVDTSVWSLVLRRRQGSLRIDQAAIVEEWKRLTTNSEAALIGIVRQEILSGIRDTAQFEGLKRALDTFPHLSTQLEDHDRAAQSYNICRSAGVSSDPVDMLICACSIRHGVPIFSIDRDYSRYAEHLPIRIHAVS